MLTEKFFLVLETLIRAGSHAEGSPRVVSCSPPVAVKLSNHNQFGG
ncbi:MAG: hypothetical protein HY852_00270 [Bradyrhizobium sp.]|nr:hypothetical protein [Bradyrhizobium sp.]MBI5260237.1 hypothetical protein [Bradyrhizobium sp.]